MQTKAFLTGSTTIFSRFAPRGHTAGRTMRNRQLSLVYVCMRVTVVQVFLLNALRPEVAEKII